MSKFKLTDIMNTKSRQAAGETDTYQEIYLSPYDVKPSESNFYSQENIEELADSFLLVGQQQPTVLGRIGGKYHIISGHRRNLANILNIERGHKQFEQVKYLYKDTSPEMLEVSLLVGNIYNRILTPYEEMEQAIRLKDALIKIKKEGNKDEDGNKIITGSIRDIVAEILNTNDTRISQLEKIQKNLIPEAKELFKAGTLKITAAHDMSQLPEKDQKEIARQAETNGARADEISKKISERKEAKKEQESEAPLPGQQNIKDIPGVVPEKLPDSGKFRRTDSPLFSSQSTNVQQANSLQEAHEAVQIEGKNKPQAAAGGETRYLMKHYINLSAESFNDVIEGRKQYELQKNDKDYRIGDTIELSEYKEGQKTGRITLVKIIHMTEDYTGLVDGYCILGIKLMVNQEEERKEHD